MQPSKDIMTTSSLTGRGLRTLSAGLTALMGFLLLIPRTAQAQADGAASGSPEQDAQSLESSQPVESSVAGRQIRYYALLLAADQFVRLTVEQEIDEDVGVFVTVFAPDGSRLHEASGPFMLKFGVWFVATSSGQYRLGVQLVQDLGVVPRRYKLTIDELHEASDRDRARFRASRALSEANRLTESYRQEVMAASTASGVGAEGDALNFQASTWKRAAPKCQEAISLFRAANDHFGEASALMSLAPPYQTMPEEYYREGIDALNHARPIWQSLADQRMEASTLQTMGMLLIIVGKDQEALGPLSESQDLWQALADRRHEVEAWGLLATVSAQLGEPQKALEFHDRAVTICRAEGLRDEESDILVQMGQLYEDWGDFERALDRYYQALNVARAADKRGQEARILEVIAHAYGLAGDPDRPLDNLNQALAIAREIKDQFRETLLTRDFGNFYLDQGEYDKALEHLNQPLAFYRANRCCTTGQAVILRSIGIAYSKKGERQKALEALNGALSVLAFKHSSIAAGIREEIASVYLSSGNSQKALEILNQNLADSRAAHDALGEALALAGMARTERAMGKLPEAQSHIEASLNISESLRSRITGAEIRASYFAAVRKHYELYIELLMQRHSEQPNQGFDSLALRASEMARARSLLDMLAEGRVDIRKGVDPKLLKKEQALEERLNARAERQIKLLSDPRSQPQADEIATEIRGITAEYEEVKALIRAGSPAYAALTQPAPPSLQDIQNQLLDSDSLLLEYALGEDRSFLWAVTRETMASFTLPKRSEIEAAARSVYELLTARNRRPKGETQQRRVVRLAQAERDYPAAASHLTQILLGPVANLMGTKRLLVVSDGVLQYIPFAAMPDPALTAGTKDGIQPLIVRHEIISLPSASVLAVTRSQIAGRVPAPKLVAVLADPVFDREDPRVQARENAPAETAKDARPSSIGLERSIAEVGLTEAGARIPRLPFSRREAEAIATLSPAGQKLEAIDFEASRATATSHELAQYRILHFATHGLLNSETPELSGLVFSLVDRQGRPQNGFLRLHEVYNLDLPADLVVLSACQTGLGKDIKGEGLVGLTRGFMYAGAARVVASLWKVDDAATAELMSRFYKHMLTEGARPAAALRAAQVEVLHHKRWEFPYYWAAFGLQGEWK